MRHAGRVSDVYLSFLFCFAVCASLRQIIFFAPWSNAQITCVQALQTGSRSGILEAVGYAEYACIGSTVSDLPLHTTKASSGTPRRDVPHPRCKHRYASNRPKPRGYRHTCCLWRAMADAGTTSPRAWPGSVASEPIEISQCIPSRKRQAYGLRHFHRASRKGGVGPFDSAYTRLISNWAHF